MATGRLKFYSIDKRYGFIAREATDPKLKLSLRL